MANEKKNVELKSQVNPNRKRVVNIFIALLLGIVHAMVFDLIILDIISDLVFMTVLGQRILWIPRLVIFSFFAFTILFTFLPSRPFMNKGIYIQTDYGTFVTCYLVTWPLILFSIMSNEVVVAYLALSAVVFSAMNSLFLSPAFHFSMVSTWWAFILAVVGGILLLSSSTQVDKLAEVITFTGRKTGSSFPVSFLSASGTVFANPWLVSVTMGVFYIILLEKTRQENTYYFSKMENTAYLDPKDRGLENIQRYWSYKQMLRRSYF